MPNFPFANPPSMWFMVTNFRPQTTDSIPLQKITINHVLSHSTPLYLLPSCLYSFGLPNLLPYLKFDVPSFYASPPINSIRNFVLVNVGSQDDDSTSQSQTSIPFAFCPLYPSNIVFLICGT